MAKQYSKQQRERLCDEFMQSGETREQFTKSKNIGLSTLWRWLSERKETRDSGKQRLSGPIQLVKVSSSRQEPIQIVLVSGIKINVPTHFCKESLAHVFSLLGEDNA